MKATFAKIRVNQNNGSLQSQTPVTLKNQVREIHHIEDLSDVAPVDVETGSTLIYNSETDKYEIRKINSGDFSGTLNLDGGEF